MPMRLALSSSEGSPGLSVVAVLLTLLFTFSLPTAVTAGPDFSSRADGGEGAIRFLPQFLDSLRGDVWDSSTVTGFVEGRLGLRTQEDPHEDDVSLGETRLQLECEGELGPALLELTVDFIYDSVPNEHHVQLETGGGWLDLRKAAVTFTPADVVDVKIGRQILTWGTGDLLFINDLFPKDWNAFFIGRDEEYLKAPSDAVKLSIFTDLANFDLVYTPRFDANRFPDNRRISQWNPIGNMLIGNEAEMRLDRPDDFLGDDEISIRLYRNIRGYEYAFYAYRGFWKDPRGFDTVARRATFPDLSVLGASVRGTIGRGVGNIEIGYYDSGDDRNGDDWLVPNSQFRLLVGYEQEIGRDFTAGLQYYLEHMSDYRSYEQEQLPDHPVADEDRHLITVRLTKLLLRQNLTLSIFSYWSPSDHDAYLRGHAHYKVTDSFSVEGGCNVFLGEEPHTFFGQFDDNTNIYAGIRHSF